MYLTSLNSFAIIKNVNFPYKDIQGGVNESVFRSLFKGF